MTKYLAFAGRVLGPFDAIEADEGRLIAGDMVFPLDLLGDHDILDEGPPGALGDFSWDRKAEAYVATAEAMARARAQALDELASLRWEACQTFAYDNVQAPADSALGAVVGFVVGAQIAAPTGPTTWKLAPGEFRSWTLANVTAYGIAIRAHIQACFDREAELTAGVFAATTVEEIEAIAAQARSGWPQ